MKNKETVFLIAILVLAFCAIIFVREHGKHDCRFTVKLNGKKPIKANVVNYYKAGVIDVVDCKGQHTVYPTTQVETITEEP